MKVINIACTPLQNLASALLTQTESPYLYINHLQDFSTLIEQISRDKSVQLILSSFTYVPSLLQINTLNISALFELHGSWLAQEQAFCALLLAEERQENIVYITAAEEYYSHALYKKILTTCRLARTKESEQNVSSPVCYAPSFSVKESAVYMDNFAYCLSQEVLRQRLIK